MSLFLRRIVTLLSFSPVSVSLELSCIEWAVSNSTGIVNPSSSLQFGQGIPQLWHSGIGFSVKRGTMDIGLAESNFTLLSGREGFFRHH